MDQIADKQYCQSCGMPLRFDIEEYLGTNADHSRSDEYCYYCLKDGEYIVDIPMGEMVDIWVKYTDKYNGYSGTNYTPLELRVLLNKRLPSLKRWCQKENTQCVHHEATNEVRAYINQNLFCDLTPEQLAEMVNLSFYHFRRVFKSVTGENVGTYIQRLRLEYIAHLLIATGQSIEKIREQTNYQTKFSLAKAFKKHFGLSMSEYRVKYKSIDKQFVSDNLPEPEIKRINTQKAVCLEVGDTFYSKHAYTDLWKELVSYKEKYLKPDAKNHFVSISLDNPVVTSIDQCRFYIGIMSVEEVNHKGRFSIQEVPGGMYVVFQYKGNYADLPDFYKAIYEEWFPGSGYYQKKPLTFEVYCNTPSETALDELLTEIYIPIDNQK